MRFILLAVAMSACSQRVVLNQSGTRLQALGYDTRVGPVDEPLFFDADLGMHCTFVRTALAEWRCLPLQPARADINGTSFFSDAGCTQRVGLVAGPSDCSAPVEAPKIIQANTESARNADGCRPAPRFFTVGSEVRGGFSGAGTSCIALEASQRLRSFLVADELPIDTFVKASAEPFFVGGRYEGVRLKGEDNSAALLVAALYDTEADLHCSFQLGKDFNEPAHTICAPLIDGSSNATFADTACGQALASVPSQPRTTCDIASLHERASPRPILAVTSGESCNRTTQFYEDGGPTTATTAFYQQDGQCSLQPNWGTTGLHQAGALVSISAKAETRNDPQRPSGIALPGGPVIETPSVYYDTRQETQCVPQMFEGQPRCVPRSAGFGAVSVYFTDAACTKPAMHSSECNVRFVYGVKLHLIDTVGVECLPHRFLYRVNNERFPSGTPLFDGGLGCDPIEAASDSMVSLTELGVDDLREMPIATPKVY